MEEFEETMLGSFELSENMFRKMCGIMVDHDGLIKLDLCPVPGFTCGKKKNPPPAAPQGGGRKYEAYEECEINKTEVV